MNTKMNRKDARRKEKKVLNERSSRNIHGKKSLCFSLKTWNQKCKGGERHTGKFDLSDRVHFKFFC